MRIFLFRYDEKSKKKPTDKMINFFKLYKFATAIELFLLIIAITFTLIKSLAMPFLIIVYSEFVALLVERTYRGGTSSKTYLLSLFGGGKILTNASIAENNKELYNDSISYGILMTLASLTIFLSGVLSVDLFNRVALKQITRIRNLFFRSVMRQDIGWHDVATDQNFALRITDDIEKIRDGISEKVSHFLNLVLGFIITLIISFYYGWKLTLALAIYIPIIMLTNYFVGKYQGKLTIKESNAYSDAANLIEEVLSGIRTVVAFNGEQKEADRYDQFLIPARKAGQRKGAFSGFGEGVLRSFLFLSCGAAFWYGINLILADREKEVKEYTPAILMIAFFGIIVGADNIARTAPFLESFANARAAATKIFKVIETQAKIDPMSLDGKILNYGLKGDIEFQDVFFRYPSREEITVLRGLSLKINSGETVALVGHSGCGKSTCIQLIQRFYDPLFGEILLDGLDITKYNISWLRSNIAIVGQEPVLFFGTIGENINFGKPDATQKEIEEAAKAAGVHEFITNLAQSYQTLIGEKGAQLSGGQKQRIAIARALIQNPKILLLDEATSALDYQSEKSVQEALDMARKGRTTIVVSHRLSAIKSADRIVFIEKGKVAEEGTHEELMKLNGRYYEMVTAGGIETEKNEKSGSDLSIYEKSFELDTINLQNHQNDVDNNHVVKFSPESMKADNQNGIKDEKYQKPSYIRSFKRILRVARPESWMLFLGLICAGAFGCIYPIFSVLFGEFYAALAKPDGNEALKDTAFLSIVCLIIGIVTGILCFLQIYFFNIAGVRLAMRIRSQVFKSIIKQDMSWFDQDENNVGALSAKISGDVANIQGALGFPLSNIIQSITNFTLGVSLAFYYSWQLALLCLTTVPFIAGSVVYEAKSISESTIEEKEILEEASRIATEAITNIRTVAGLRREPHIIARFNNEIIKIENKLRQKIRFRGLVNSCGQSFPFFAYAAALCYGGVLVSQGLVNFQDIIKTSEGLLYSSMMVGQSLAFLPAFTTALVAANRLFKLIDRQPAIQSQTKKVGGISNTHNSDNNDVTYSGIHFRYPKRPNTQILNDFNLNIPQGKTVALVGHSGCGKSTCIQLLQRFYDPDRGQICIDNNDIKNDLTLEELRCKLGIVSQEPVLFERTIADNIAYGDNSREVPLAEIMEAAKSANIHTFIISLPLGYETKLGSKGTQLSGGQKQRVAIARALIRNPKILLFDEATSALDLQSEKLVQAALDTACSGRTCIIIAHRLSTIQNVDIIYVVQHGRVVEQGNHQQLLAKNGIYAELYKTQPNLH